MRKSALLAVAVLFATSTAYANDCPLHPADGNGYLVPYSNFDGNYYWAGDGNGIGNNTNHDGTVIIGEYDTGGFGTYAIALAGTVSDPNVYDIYFLTYGESSSGPDYVSNGLATSGELCFGDDPQYVYLQDVSATYTVLDSSNNQVSVTVDPFDYGSNGATLYTELNGGNDWYTNQGTDSAAHDDVYGEAGNDNIYVRSGTNYVYGGIGNDSVNANSLAYVDLGTDNDCLNVLVPPSNIYCGSGTDVVYYLYGSPTFHNCESTYYGSSWCDPQ